MSLDVLGADGLSSQYITLRVKSVDVKKLGQAVGGGTGAAVPLALQLIDLAPAAALKAAMPHVAKKAQDDYGVDLEYSIADAPPVPGEQRSDMPGILKGLGLAAVGLLLWRYVGKSHV